MPSYVGAIDQGTTSTRFVIFDDKGNMITWHQLEFEQHYPKPGWIEHDPEELLDVVSRCAEEALRKFGMMGRDLKEIKAIGITNQRETTLVWDRETGEPLYNAIVWGDTRTKHVVKQLKAKQFDVQSICGLPIHNYFSAVKLHWLMSKVKDVKEAIDNKRAMFGTVDSWLIWNLTGGIHVTDTTNASRTMLMNLKTRQWDKDLLNFFEIPEHILPKIVSSSEHYGDIVSGPLEDMPLMGCLGDQQAAFVGQKCFSVGEAKNTYGTGAFMLLNVGSEPAFSKSGLLATVGYQFGDRVAYALEGSISVAGAAVSWLRDNLGIIKHAREVDELASKVEDTGGVMFVTAFSGLFAPYWRDDARGTLVGLTQYTNKCHIARATLEAVCYSTRAILDAMKEDGDVTLKILRADGGMSSSDICMQTQANTLGIPVERPAMRETTALGAAFAAGLAVGIWKDVEELRELQVEAATVFNSKLDDKGRENSFHVWEEAVQRSMGWTDVLYDEND
ncbi:glycerol kinase [Zychaea mexicana]|uniref:glycerol kinase n=1 Tax=Zychaea mexicana TaxID=64656 RepID=UPI0022FEC59A|nr:glycerol kinase [Zychaea mexicana]KAI9489138.1 glycerol kinase [Zychaea mexicana]